MLQGHILSISGAALRCTWWSCQFKSDSLIQLAAFCLRKLHRSPPHLLTAEYLDGGLLTHVLWAKSGPVPTSNIPGQSHASHVAIILLPHPLRNKLYMVTVFLSSQHDKSSS
jgi:hypothetical protein